MRKRLRVLLMSFVLVFIMSESVSAEENVYSKFSVTAPSLKYTAEGFVKINETDIFYDITLTPPTGILWSTDPEGYVKPEILIGTTAIEGPEMPTISNDRIYLYIKGTVPISDNGKLTIVLNKIKITPLDIDGNQAEITGYVPPDPPDEGGNEPPDGGNLPPTKDWGAVDDSKIANACGGGKWTSPIRNWVDNIFCPVITFLDLARSKLAAVSLMMGQGLNIGQYFKIFGDLPTSWQLVVSSLLLMVATLGGLLIFRSAMRIYYSIKEGVKWW